MFIKLDEAVNILTEDIEEVKLVVKDIFRHPKKIGEMFNDLYSNQITGARLMNLYYTISEGDYDNFLLNLDYIKSSRLSDIIIDNLDDYNPKDFFDSNMQRESYKKALEEKSFFKNVLVAMMDDHLLENHEKNKRYYR